MSTLKGDIINSAYSRLRISGITKNPSPADIKLALERLEDMMASWGAWNIDLGYVFEEAPDTGTPHGLAREYLAGVKSNLAMILLADYGKEAPMPLMLEAGGAFAQLLASSVKTARVTYPNRMPIGSGNQQVTNWQRFAPTARVIAEDFSAESLFIEDIKDLEESLSYALRSDNTETITSYTITADTGLTILSDSLASPIISYRLQAGDVEVTRAIVVITATTSLGQRITKQVFFSVKGLE